MRSPAGCLIGLLVVAALAAGYFLWRGSGSTGRRLGRVLSWMRDASQHPEWAVRAGERCGEAPFIMPTDGLVGFLWDDTFRLGHRHQGIDIFGGNDVNVTPVYSAYPGYLSRMGDWKSSVIIRVPDDPLQPGRQIWTYYTHMADSAGASYIAAEFPAGTTERFVEAGTLLGYQGNYSGDPGNPVGVHLHFSIVLDDGKGSFSNELDIRNTLDPSPYLGLQLNANSEPQDSPVCVK